MEMRLELVAVPVSDVDRAKAFYTEQIGFNADHDFQVDDNMRFVQLTPPGSACSIALGTGIIDTEPGSLGGMQMVVASAADAHAELSGRGVAVSDVQEFPWGSSSVSSPIPTATGGHCRSSHRGTDARPQAAHAASGAPPSFRLSRIPTIRPGTSGSPGAA